MRSYFEAPSFDAVRTESPALAVVRARYQPEAVWRELRASSVFNDARVVPYLLFPLDERWLYYEQRGKLLNEKRPEFWDNLPGNEFLVSVPQPRRVSETRPLLARTLVDLHAHDRGSVCFPRESASGALVSERTANLFPGAWTVLKSAWDLPGDFGGDAAKRLVSRLFRLALAIMHAPQYERDHADAIAQDWAHLPIPKRMALLDQLADVGNELAVLLDPTADAGLVVDGIIGRPAAKRLGVLTRSDGGAICAEDLTVEVSYYGAAVGRWTPRTPSADEGIRACWGGTTGDLAINSTVRFSNVPESVWRYELGGYPVLKKWLGYRHRDRRDRRPLSLEEAKHFRSMVQRLAALLVLHDRLDGLYGQACAEAFTAEELGLRGSVSALRP
jgi:hypothetical protein